MMNDYRGENLTLKAYKLYIALKLHFNSKYDFFFYNGNVPNIKLKTLNDKHDRFYFHKLSKHIDPIWLLVANLTTKSNMYIGDIVSKEGQERYLVQQATIQSLSYVFSEEIKKISISDFKTDTTKFPNIITKMNQKEISLETTVILLDILKLLPHWNEIYKNNIIWEPIHMKLSKYTPFIKYDEEKFANMIKEQWL